MRKQSNGKIRRTESEWEAIIERFENSGLSAAAFCRREKISKNTLWPTPRIYLYTRTVIGLIT